MPEPTDIKQVRSSKALSANTGILKATLERMEKGGDLEGVQAVAIIWINSDSQVGIDHGENISLYDAVNMAGTIYAGTAHNFVEGEE